MPRTGHGFHNGIPTMEKDDTAGGKDNVVSLDRARIRRTESQTGETAAEPEGAREADQTPEAIPGSITWLHCPSCDTLEYTEIAMEGGRRHKCGSIVEEAEVEIDVRAEYTISQINLERIRALSDYLESQRRHFEEYSRRLETIAGETPAAYPMSEDLMKLFPVGHVDPLGLMISKALHEPAGRFKEGG